MKDLVYMTRIWTPAVFQGKLTAGKYFEGWYFKQVGADSVISLIPGVSLTEEPHSFIQLIESGGQIFYFKYPLSSFEYSRKKMYIKIADSVFSDEGINLDISHDGHKISGKLVFSDMIKYPSRLFSPGIMGWYSFVPFMECYHGAVSVSHKLSGNIVIDGSEKSFDGGSGYIEKDWGKSFPESWIWTHCGNFSDRNMSFMLSIANIPWLGKSFTGFLGFLMIDGRIITFATYNGSKIEKAELNSDGDLSVMIKTGKYYIDAVLHHNTSGLLKAPQNGKMNRYIKESIDSEIELTLRNKKGDVILSEKGIHAGLEINGDILSNF